MVSVAVVCISGENFARRLELHAENYGRRSYKRLMCTAEKS